MPDGDARHALLAHLIDHAPTFPPASMPVDEALAEDARAAASPHAFMLARLVWPASRLGELPPTDRAISAVLDAAVSADCRVEAIETPPFFDPGAGGSGFPTLGEVYVETPLDEGLEDRLDHLSEHGLRAKVRCGGATVPTAAALAGFVRACHERRLVFKATAGLHHAVRSNGEHGLLNLLAAVVFTGEEEAALGEVDSSAFALDAESFAWRNRAASVDELARVRREVLHSIGSCSFFEPVDESSSARDASVVRGAVGFGVFSVGANTPRVGFRVTEGVLDLAAAGLGTVFEAPTLNPFLALGRSSWEDTLARVDELVSGGAELVALDAAREHLPFEVADYVDFYSSLEHATNLGRLFRPDAEPLLPNWRHLPVGYHGRAGTVVVSGTPVVRPSGQTKAASDDAPRYGPSRRLDIELELGFVVGVGSTLGDPVSTATFRDHVFGVALVNDWSARDIQAWEYVPLGPFLGKSFATSIAAWVTPLALLEDRFVPAPEQDPPPLPYLRTEGDWALDVELEVELSGTVVSRTNARGLYWTMPQQLAHSTANGASIRAGDLFASGTISGAEPGSEGSLIELTWNGERPVKLDDGSERTFLEDGDEVVLRGRAGAIELAEVRGTILPAR